MPIKIETFDFGELDIIVEKQNDDDLDESTTISNEWVWVDRDIKDDFY